MYEFLIIDRNGKKKYFDVGFGRLIDGAFGSLVAVIAMSKFEL